MDKPEGCGEVTGSVQRGEALRRACLAVDQMQANGLVVRLTGSITRGEFRPGSDVDFLVESCPSQWRYRIEGVVEDVMGLVPFDVIYLDELTPGRARLVQRDARWAHEVAV